MNWGETQERALETIKSELTREVTLSRSGPGMYHLHVDSSKIVTASHIYTGTMQLFHIQARVLCHMEGCQNLALVPSGTGCGDPHRPSSLARLEPEKTTSYLDKGYTECRG
eukprot:TRINITY_DN2106_c1_g2_i1.p1 TRINITY_DN2106_c1_g2~~TRINITY_DN2106_c1_g2_i1.p1  ORF type:complete len:111 (+),score=7.78 TRINITY_DN2106_c1_g2_i1:506-838(+)